MAGHSRWANIRFRKERMDAKKGKVFNRLIKEISVAAKVGGSDPVNNPRLRLALEKARENNVPRINIERALRRSSANDTNTYEEIRYEGYAPNNIAVIVDCLTDNKNRTVAEIRHAFTKHSGNLAATGSVSYLFNFCGQILYAQDKNELEIIEISSDIGAQDILNHNDGSIEVITSPESFFDVKSALEMAGYIPDFAEVGLKAQSDVNVSGQDAQKVRQLIDALENARRYATSLH